MLTDVLLQELLLLEQLRAALQQLQQSMFHVTEVLTVQHLYQ
jgi:hypothetical protein